MSCFFCGSIYHVSHNCDKFISDDSRKEVAFLKKCCPYCFFSSTVSAPCVKCESGRKCFICFFKRHWTVYCPNRFKAPKIFPPKIDEDLLFRFGQLLNVEEKYFMALSFPNIFQLMKLKPFKVFYEKKCISFANIKIFRDFDFLAAEKLSNVNFNREIYFYAKSVLSQSPVLYIKCVHIEVPLMSTSDFLLPLSPITRILKCVNTRFSTKSIFKDILKKVPNLENIEISGSNIEVTNSWVDDFLQLNKTDNLTDICLSIPNLNFNIESLIKLMKKKTSKNVEINLYLYLSSNGNMKNVFQEEKNKFLKYFIPVKYECQRRVILWITNGSNGNNDYEEYTLKED